MLIFIYWQYILGLTPFSYFSHKVINSQQTQHSCTHSQNLSVKGKKGNGKRERKNL
ncbi:hypothetical protein FDUTEX481_05420 [Tolypothrix sp. PCC 7601]|nr:hypothetical protein FDUTEX481_05420 [Tolypothrix sp. PCC 7601]